MRNQNYLAAGSEPAAFCKSFRAYNSKPKMKRKPAYYAEYLEFSSTNLIFLAKNWNIMNFVRRLGCRTCLLCEDLPQFYDLSFCCDKEV